MDPHCSTFQASSKSTKWILGKLGSNYFRLSEPPPDITRHSSSCIRSSRIEACRGVMLCGEFFCGLEVIKESLTYLLKWYSSHTTVYPLSDS